MRLLHHSTPNLKMVPLGTKKENAERSKEAGAIPPTFTWWTNGRKRAPISNKCASSASPSAEYRMRKGRSTSG